MTDININIKPFIFNVVTVSSSGDQLHDRECVGGHFLENLGNGIYLEMVRIPGGEFLMGSPNDEANRNDNEGPLRLVSIPEFFIGRYPITQVQWQSVASYMEVKQVLNAAPSYFDGSDRPIERINWFNAVEFCDRLSRKTGRNYSLPSEAQWEYACRAGTNTPFHFGYELTPEVANFWTIDRIGVDYHDQTTVVGRYPANAFGLHDMHGNVNEWCLDHWYDSYKAAPSDGSAMRDPKDKNNNCHHHVLRGGSWWSTQESMRSAYRGHENPDLSSRNLGFRVVCLST